MSLSVNDFVVACFDHLGLEILVANSELPQGELLIIILTAPSSGQKRRCIPNGSLFQMND